MKLSHCITLPIIVLALTAYSGPKDANEKNFKVAIQTYLDSEYPMCYIKAQFPIEVSPSKSHRTNMEAYNRLMELGILSARTEKRPVKALWGNATTEDVTIYQITEKAKPYYKTEIKKPIFGEGNFDGLCFGKAEVTKINNFSEPATINGYSVSRVNYNYRISDIPDWAQDETILKSFHKLASDVATTKEDAKEMATLILTNEGWVHERIFKN